MVAKRIIPIKVAASAGVALADEARIRLERAGFLRIMALAEPRLSEFVARYKALGYEVELVPYADELNEGVSVEDYATLYVRKATPTPGRV